MPSYPSAVITWQARGRTREIEPEYLQNAREKDFANLRFRMRLVLSLRSGWRGRARASLQAPVGSHGLNELREIGHEKLDRVPLFGRGAGGFRTRLFELRLDLAAIVRCARESVLGENAQGVRGDLREPAEHRVFLNPAIHLGTKNARPQRRDDRGVARHGRQSALGARDLHGGRLARNDARF